MAEVSKYDNSLFGILHSEGDVPSFLESVFGFLYRRTDFFKIQHDKAEKIGFPKGQAEYIVKNAFHKFYEKALAEDELLQRRLLEMTVSEEIPYTIKDGMSSRLGGRSHLKRIAKRRLSSKTENSSSEMAQNDVQNACDAYNGAVRDTYCWSQTFKDVDVQVFVPSHIVSGKNVNVEITSESLNVRYRYLPLEDWQTILDDRLTNCINVDESIWTLVPGEHIHLNLEKTTKKWWSGLLVSEPSIDVQNIDVSTPFEELDEESQTKLLETVYNHTQTNQGKLTMDQLKMKDILKEAWDKEGSVFKGQPFDPSTVDIINSSVTIS